VKVRRISLNPSLNILTWGIWHQNRHACTFRGTAATSATVPLVARFRGSARICFLFLEVRGGRGGKSFTLEVSSFQGVWIPEGEKLEIPDFTNIPADGLIEVDDFVRSWRGKGAEKLNNVLCVLLEFCCSMGVDKTKGCRGGVPHDSPVPWVWTDFDGLAAAESKFKSSDDGGCPFFNVEGERTWEDGIRLTADPHRTFFHSDFRKGGRDRDPRRDHMACFDVSCVVSDHLEGALENRRERGRWSRSGNSRKWTWTKTKIWFESLRVEVVDQIHQPLSRRFSSAPSRWSETTQLTSNMPCGPSSVPVSPTFPEIRVEKCPVRIGSQFLMPSSQVLLLQRWRKDNLHHQRIWTCFRRCQTVKICQTTETGLSCGTPPLPALRFVYPHWAAELEQYAQYIIQFFSAFPTSGANKVVNLDRPSAGMFGEVWNLELFSFGNFRHLEARYLQSEGLAASSSTNFPERENRFSQILWTLPPMEQWRVAACLWCTSMSVLVPNTQVRMFKEGLRLILLTFTRIHPGSSLGCFFYSSDSISPAA